MISRSGHNSDNSEFSVDFPKHFDDLSDIHWLRGQFHSRISHLRSAPLRFSSCISLFSLAWLRTFLSANYACANVSSANPPDDSNKDGKMAVDIRLAAHLLLQFPTREFSYSQISSPYKTRQNADNLFSLHKISLQCVVFSFNSFKLAKSWIMCNSSVHC